MAWVGEARDVTLGRFLDVRAGAHEPTLLLTVIGVPHLRGSVVSLLRVIVILLCVLFCIFIFLSGHVLSKIRKKHTFHSEV
jgi:hypothetical protein